MENLIEVIKAVGPAVGIIAVVLLVALAIVLGNWGAKKVWRRRFTEIFGFAPEKDWPGRMIQKQDVVKVLGRLAYAFDRACKTENAIFGKHTNPNPGYFSQEEELRKLRNARESVQRTKREFWTAHKAADVSGFSVEEKYDDYL